MQLRHLRYFVKIVEAGSISRASTIVHVAQPALSQQIAELEEELGVSLLQRSARGVRPTAAGEALYREATSILRQIERLADVVRSPAGEAEGAVSLGMSSTLASSLAGPFMEACRAALPKVVLRFVADDSRQLVGRIDGHTLDLAAVFEDEPIARFDRRPLFRQRLYVVRRGSRRSARPVPLAQLAERPLVLAASPNVSRSALERALADAGMAANVVAEANVLSSTLSAVQAGVGDTVLPKGDFAGAPGHEGLVPLPIEPPVYLTAVVLSSKDVALTRAGEAVRDLLGEFVRRHLHEAHPPGAEAVAA